MKTRHSASTRISSTASRLLSRTYEANTANNIAPAWRILPSVIVMSKVTFMDHAGAGGAFFFARETVPDVGAGVFFVAAICDASRAPSSSASAAPSPTASASLT